MSLKIPIGISDFRKLRESGATYVDKTSFIRDVLANSAEVMLFLRPRRFGKTINLSALRWFLERNEVSAAALFDGLAVWGDAASREHFQRYPVIALTFKDAKFTTHAELEREVVRLVATEYDRHRELEESAALSQHARAKYRRLAMGSADIGEVQGALADLARWLHAHHGERAVILIDEYDVPIHASLVHGYAEEALGLFRNFLSAGLKDNPNIYKGLLTGVLRVAKESLFSGLNNLAVYGVTVPEFEADFGFTAAEVRALLDSVGQPELLEPIAQWYDGYLFGGARIYNPWSVLSFLHSKDRVLRPHWRATGAEDLLRDLLLRRGLGLRDEMELLLAGHPVIVPIDESVALRDLERRPTAIWSFLLYSGYLTASDAGYDAAGTLRAAVAIPNREVRGTYLSIFSEWLGDRLGSDATADELVQALLLGDAEGFQRHLAALVLGVLSCHDTGGRDTERVYHAFLLGLLARLEGRFDVRSDRESGFGRADLLIMPRTPGDPGVVLEVKRLSEGESMDAALTSALEQIRSRDYAAELRARGARPVSAFAVVFEGKRVAVRAA